MTVDDQTPHDLDALTAEPDQLDGHSIDELADYLDAGRTPIDESIEASPACRHALAALERLRTVTSDLLTDDTAAIDDNDEWTNTVMARITLDAHAGADFVIDTTAGDETVMTEGALRALIRSAGDEDPGFLVGRIRFAGDLAGDTDPATISVDVIVAHGTPIPNGVDRLRQLILEQVRRHTRLTHPRIDITVRDLWNQTP